jgi:hypothetical protein
VGIGIGVVVSTIGIILQYSINERGEKKKNRINLVYGPLFGAMTEILRNAENLKNISKSDLSKLTAGFPVEATQEFKVIEDIFTRWPHLIQNEKITQGWGKIRIQRDSSSQRVFMWIDQNIDSWFKEIEKEYHELKK